MCRWPASPDELTLHLQHLRVVDVLLLIQLVLQVADLGVLLLLQFPEEQKRPVLDRALDGSLISHLIILRRIVYVILSYS